MAVIIPIQADDTQFQSAMSALKGSVEKSSADIVRAIEGMSKKSTKAVDGLSEAEKKAAAQAKEAAKGMEDLADVSGLPVDKIKKLSEGFQAAIGSMSSAQVGMVAFGGAAMAAAASATIAVGAAYKLADGIVSIVQSSAEAIPDLKELEDLFGLSLVPDETVERVLRADAALTSVGTSASILSTTIAGQLAPNVTDLATTIVAANLALSDFLASNTMIITAVKSTGTAFVDFMMVPIKGTILTVGALIKVFALMSEATTKWVSTTLGSFESLADVLGLDFADSLGRAKDAADSLGTSFSDSLHGIADGAIALGQTSITDNLDAITGALSDQLPAANDLINANLKLQAAQERKKKDDKESEAAARAAAAAYKSSSEQLDKLAGAYAIAATAGMARVKAEHEANKAEIESLYETADANAKTIEEKLAASDARIAALKAEEQAYVAAVAKQKDADDKAAEAAAKKAEDEKKRAEQAAKAQSNMVKGIAAIATAETNRFLKGQKLVTAEHQLSLDKIEDMRAEALAAATTEEQRVAANEAANAAIAASTAGYHKDIQAMTVASVKNIAAGVGAAAKAVVGVAQKAMSAIGFNFQSIMSAASSEDGPKAAIKEMADQAKSFIKNLPSAIKAFTAELPGVINGLVAGIPDIVDAIVNALPMVVGAIVGALPELFDAIKSSLPKLVKSVVDLLPVLILGIIKELPGLVKMLTKQIPILVDGLLAALPDILMAIFDALPDIIVAIVKMIPALIAAIVKNLPAIIKALVVGIFKMAIEWLWMVWKPLAEALGKAVKWVADKVKAYFIALKDAVVFFFQKWIDMWKETLTLGRADTSLDDRKGRRSYGDSPGIVRAGPQGMTVQASPGDYVNIGRNRQQLLDRALSGSGVAQPPAAVAPAPVLVLNDHVRQWDKLGYRLARTGGLSVDISNRTTKNARGR